MPQWLQAAAWGGLAGGALVLGAAAGYGLRIPQRLIAAVMAFGSGVLISTLSFDLMDEAYTRGFSWQSHARGCSPERVSCAGSCPRCRR
jgi:ZIP family zinc transporter